MVDPKGYEYITISFTYIAHLEKNACADQKSGIFVRQTITLSLAAQSAMPHVKPLV